MIELNKKISSVNIKKVINNQKNPNIMCLFTRDDWDVWEKLEFTSKLRELPKYGLYIIIDKTIRDQKGIVIGKSKVYQCLRCNFTTSYHGNKTGEIRKMRIHVLENHIIEGKLTEICIVYQK